MGTFLVQYLTGNIKINNTYMVYNFKTIYHYMVAKLKISCIMQIRPSEKCS